LIFENIGNSLIPPTICYDLKGTTNNKRKVNDGDKKTKMDLNFIEDFSSLPLPISLEQKKILKASTMNDTLFLSKQNIVDYSMLLVISLKDRKISLGIIDYMQQYTFDKVIENKYKEIIRSQVPTITNPNQYKIRFREQILNNYFAMIED
jgi:Phosphatidylinositol-4-phosphate 5-kinase